QPARTRVVAGLCGRFRRRGSRRIQFLAGAAAIVRWCVEACRSRRGVLGALHRLVRAHRPHGERPRAGRFRAIDRRSLAGTGTPAGRDRATACCGRAVGVRAMRPLAILGGTFDPVHLGHLRAAWEAAEALDAEVRLVPAHVPPHRSAPVASAPQRVAILRAALAGQDRLKLDTRELDRDGPSYTYDTLAGLRPEIGARPLVLLIGSDAFAALPTWHRWRELFG